MSEQQNSKLSDQGDCFRVFASLLDGSSLLLRTKTHHRNLFFFLELLCDPKNPRFKIKFKCIFWLYRHPQIDCNGSFCPAWCLMAWYRRPKPQHFFWWFVHPLSDHFPLAIKSKKSGVRIIKRTTFWGLTDFRWSLEKLSCPLISVRYGSSLHRRFTHSLNSVGKHHLDLVLLLRSGSV